MSDIYVDRVGMELRLREVIARIDDSDASLSALPSAPDAGIATSMIALIASAGAEAAGVANDAARALTAITNDVLEDMTLSNDAIAEQIRDIQDELEER